MALNGAFCTLNGLVLRDWRGFVYGWLIGTEGLRGQGTRQPARTSGVALGRFALVRSCGQCLLHQGEGSSTPLNAR